MNNQRNPWRTCRTAEQIRQHLQAALPEEATLADVRALTLWEQMECSDLVEDTIYCSIEAPSRMPFVKSKWLVQFHFRDDALQSVEVTEGLTGP